MAAMEERLLGKSDLEREKDGEFVKARKLTKLVERYKMELNEARLEIRDLKARLLESSDIHVSHLYKCSFYSPCKLIPQASLIAQKNKSTTFIFLENNYFSFHFTLFFNIENSIKREMK